MTILQLVESYSDPETTARRLAAEHAAELQASFTMSEDEPGTLVQYHGREQDVAIPAELGVTHIGAYAFGHWGASWKRPSGIVEPLCDWRRIRTVVVPEGVVEIGPNAFARCEALESITLPSTLERIGAEAFKGCEYLREVTLPPSLEKIEPFAFQGCRDLQHITLPPALQKVAAYAFQGCKGLRRIALPASLQELAPYAFQGCKELVEVTVAGEGCRGIIYRSAFADCPKLVEPDPLASLPSTVTVVNDAAFAGMFEGAAHELRCLKFGRRARHSWETTKSEYRIVDLGVEGLNHFAVDLADDEEVGFTIRLDDGCDRGYYAIRDASAPSASGERIEAYLSPKGNSYRDPDTAQRGYSKPWRDVYLYLWQCHLVLQEPIDADRAAQLVDAYRSEVVPLASEYLRVQNDDTGEYRQYRKYKGLMLSTLDGLHAKIKALTEQFEQDASGFGIDTQHYVALYSQGLGSGLAPSKEEYRRREEEKRKRREGTDRVTDSVLDGCLRGCGWLIVHAIYAVFMIIMALGLLMIMLL